MAKNAFMTAFWITVLTIIGLGLLHYKDGGVPTRNDRTKLEHILCQQNPSRC